MHGEHWGRGLIPRTCGAPRQLTNPSFEVATPLGTRITCGLFHGSKAATMKKVWRRGSGASGPRSTCVVQMSACVVQMTRAKSGGAWLAKSLTKNEANSGNAQRKETKGSKEINLCWHKGIEAVRSYEKGKRLVKNQGAKCLATREGPVGGVNSGNAHRKAPDLRSTAVASAKLWKCFCPPRAFF